MHTFDRAYLLVIKTVYFDRKKNQIGNRNQQKYKTEHFAIFEKQNIRLTLQDLSIYNGLKQRLLRIHLNHIAPGTQGYDEGQFGLEYI